ncbi:MAG: DUF1254 domain-containing protein [Candidatus Obscuribacterales bacterium]|nr:DUF1254 domain-containing protein [Candidatus Obscuribacterales bacterium]
MANLNSTVVSGKQTLSAHEAHEIGMEAYFYFYPLVLMEVTRRQSVNLEAGKRPGFGPANSFTHMRAYPDANFRTVVRPNFDTLYSVAWLDLKKEPVIVSIPDTAGRYYLLPFLDMWTDVFAVPGWRTSGTEAQTYAVTAPGWSGNLPAGIKQIKAPSPVVWIIGRIKTDGPDDYKNVHAIQDACRITTLSQMGKDASPESVKPDPSVDMQTAPLETLAKMSASQFLTEAAELLKIYPPHHSDWSMLQRLSRLGLEVGKSFDFKSLNNEIQEALQKAAEDALKLMIAKTKSMGKAVDGWAMNTESMGVYGNNYMKRAIVALVGLGANQPEDAIYPLNFADADGQPLKGEENYVLHFAKNNLPPVSAFWSVTMYDADGFQSANELNRFALSSWMPLKKNEDGSLDLYLQHKNPGSDKESNWLPSPASGVLGVTMRLYAPHPEALNGDWNPPAIKKVN